MSNGSPIRRQSDRYVQGTLPERLQRYRRQIARANQMVTLWKSILLVRFFKCLLIVCGHDYKIKLKYFLNNIYVCACVKRRECKECYATHKFSVYYRFSNYFAVISNFSENQKIFYISFPFVTFL